MKLTVIVAKVVSTNDYLIQTTQPNEFYALEFLHIAKLFARAILVVCLWMKLELLAAKTSFL